jgi:hypothetical protein
LNEDARPRVELIDISLDAWEFPKQRLFIDDVSLRIDWCARLLGEGRRRESDEAADHSGGKYNARARRQICHGPSFMSCSFVDALASRRAHAVMSSP